MSEVVNRFLKYVALYTTSDPNSNEHPSSMRQFDLLRLLKEELKNIGFEDVFLSEFGYLYGKLPKNAQGYKALGLVAHVDTSPDCKGEGVVANLFEEYDGKDIIQSSGSVIKVCDYPFLTKLKGRTIITSSGDTLLGADDKAGIAEILTAVNFVASNNIPHGDIYVAFTPDEEIGEGTLNFDLKKFPCELAFTVDGGEEGEISYENFNAASVKAVINGINIHPGNAKDVMKNSSLIAFEFNSMLDSDSIPAKTEGRQGFNHLTEIVGKVERTEIKYIVRNHDKQKFESQKARFVEIAKILNEKYGDNTVVLDIKDSYYNMYDVIKDKMEIVEIAKCATEKANVPVKVIAIRGGTDGATLTFMGVPTPNIGTGGYNFHSKSELITKEGMEKVVEIIVNIIKEVKN